MSDDKTITLGGKEFPIAPLTLGQMRQAGPAFMRLSFNTPEGIGAHATLLYLAMHNADPKVTPADVDAIVGVSFDELNASAEKIAKSMGVVLKAAEPGEAKPVAPETASATSTGSKSTAA